MSFAGPTVPCTILLALVLLGVSPPCHGGDAAPPTHSIAAILAANPDFSDFGAALVATNLTGKIDERHAITVLAVDNAAVGRLRARGLPAESLAHVLSLHVLLDYYDAAKLQATLSGASLRTQAASLYQASGAAPGSAGIVSIAKGGDGRAWFSAEGDAAGAVFFQRSVKESPYDIAVLQVSDAISSPAAEGRAPAPSDWKAPQPSPAPVAAPPSHPAPVGAPPATNQTASPPPKQAGTPAPAPAPKPAGKPASPPTKPADPPADAPGDDDQPPADEEGQHKNAAAGTAPWIGGVAVAAAVTAVVLLL